MSDPSKRAKKIMAEHEAALAQGTPEGAHWLLASFFEDGSTTIAASAAVLGMDLPALLRQLATSLESMAAESGRPIVPMIVPVGGGKGRPS